MKPDPMQLDLFAWADARPSATVHDLRLARTIRWARNFFRGTLPAPVTKPGDVVAWPTERRQA